MHNVVNDPIPSIRGQVVSILEHVPFAKLYIVTPHAVAVFE